MSDLGDLGGLGDLPDLGDLDDLDLEVGDFGVADLDGGVDLPDPFAADAGTDTGVDWAHYEPYEPMWLPEDFDGIGDPLGLADHWVLQSGETCGVVSQGMVIESLTGHPVDQAALTEIAESNGWYDPATGTRPTDMTRLLEMSGLETATSWDANIVEIGAALERGDHAIVGVNSDAIWEPLRDADADPVRQGGADHAVWVTGVDRAADGTYYVILNDSGQADGAAAPVALPDFMNAWDASGNFLVIAHAPGEETAI